MGLVINMMCLLLAISCFFAAWFVHWNAGQREQLYAQTHEAWVAVTSAAQPHPQAQVADLPGDLELIARNISAAGYPEYQGRLRRIVAIFQYEGVTGTLSQRYVADDARQILAEIGRLPHLGAEKANEIITWFFILLGIVAPLFIRWIAQQPLSSPRKK